MAARKKSAPKGISTAQIGRCGELLVQYHLLLRGIESAPMTTDAGIDLVAYASKTGIPATIQVKTNHIAKPGGGKGKLALDWWVPVDTPAQFIALIDLSSQRLWFFTPKELKKNAQQKSNGRYHFYMYTDPQARPRTGMASHDYDFEKFLFENRVHELFET